MIHITVKERNALHELVRRAAYNDLMNTLKPGACANEAENAIRDFILTRCSACGPSLDTCRDCPFEARNDKGMQLSSGASVSSLVGEYCAAKHKVAATIHEFHLNAAHGIETNRGAVKTLEEKLANARERLKEGQRMGEQLKARLAEEVKSLVKIEKSAGITSREEYKRPIASDGGIAIASLADPEPPAVDEVSYI